MRFTLSSASSALCLSSAFGLIEAASAANRFCVFIAQCENFLANYRSLKLATVSRMYLKKVNKNTAPGNETIHERNEKTDLKCKHPEAKSTVYFMPCRLNMQPSPNY